MFLMEAASSIDDSVTQYDVFIIGSNAPMNTPKKTVRRSYSIVHIYIYIDEI